MNDKPHLKKQRFAKSKNALAAFLLQEGGAREKLTKENAVKGISLSAESEEDYAPSTSKLLKKLDQNFPSKDSEDKFVSKLGDPSAFALGCPHTFP